MNVKKKIKVLVVDDSMLFRRFLAGGIDEDPLLEVVATASDPYMARDKILEVEPDVMTLDVELPRMNGIDFLRKLMPQYPLPVIVVSSVSESVFDALDAGAVDFVAKPDAQSLKRQMFLRELIVKIKIAATAQVGHHKHTCGYERLAAGTGGLRKNKLIAIGASTGGTEAIYEVLRSFSCDMPGTVAVLHMPPVFTGMYAKRLNQSCAVEVKEAQTGDVLCPGRVLIAPGGNHMRLKRQGKIYTVECRPGDNVNGHCPSVDVLFASVAEQAGAAAVGVILTGMGYDGAKGLLKMKQAGAKTIGQDEKSSVVYGMPKVAYDLGAVTKQVSLEKIARQIDSFLTE